MTTPEQQKEYVITEEQLQQLHTQMKKNPLGEGHGSTHITMAWYETKNLLELVRSRPYNPAAEREKVLECRQEVQDFAVLMEQKLRKNDHKNHWSKESFTYLFSRLDEEMTELNQAVASAKTDYTRITDEAIDVANFLMMIVDNLKELRQQGAQKG